MRSLLLVTALLAGGPENPVVASEGISFTSYKEALDQSNKAQKPIVVFFGPGQSGYRELIGDSPLDKEVQRILSESYLPVFVDTTTPEGQRWMTAFEMSEVGIVVSDRTGAYQMLFHKGTMPADELQSQLNRLRQANVRVSLYPPASTTNTYRGFTSSMGAAYCPT